jgi:hypothetical protein
MVSTLRISPKAIGTLLLGVPLAFGSGRVLRGFRPRLHGVPRGLGPLRNTRSLFGRARRPTE